MDHRESPIRFSDGCESLKILGLSWEPSIDAFTFHTQPFNSPCTKRNILSFIAKTFDPLGYLSSITIFMKSVLQKLWLFKLGWDCPVPPSLETTWLKFVFSIPSLNQLKVSRFVTPSKYDSVSLVGFCDASESGYAAKVYLCFESTYFRSSLLWQAKSKVAPSKILSIPRLELSGACLLAKLVKIISQRITVYFIHQAIL